MDNETYLALSRICGHHLLRPCPGPYEIDPEEMPTASAAVYIAADERNQVCYVGSVCRPKDPEGLASHVREYLKAVQKTARWRYLYVLPLRSNTAEAEVRGIAGEVSGWLLPYDRERWSDSD
ncbi:hypothetical protein ACFQY7_43880 [Actinomadura luteofluorescens]|uniref:GIY-YIG nuclease family protein n=1 Tax=Actinomadura luteofluorescens TaxID=46163 RepID=A0A7Y9JHQ1_9ACTN|nr:hypothetical protein [Actinomadura luteofluorescens]NYD47604.1 hypothetical protein [Actinomadura luteofluorescens]